MTILMGDFSDVAAIRPPAAYAVHPGLAAGMAGSPTRAAARPAPAARPTRTGTAQGVDPALPEDARLYLRHIEGGETIRALARETGCHASTILRRIRRFEARRDDPLVDRAVDRAAGTAAEAEPARGMTRHDLDQARRILRRLAEPGAVLAVAEGLDKAIVTRSDIRTAVLDRRLAEQMALRGWVALTGQGRITRHVITPAGRAALKEMVSGRLVGLPEAQDFTDGRPVAGGVHGMAEAPAGWEGPETGDAGPAEAQRHRIHEDRMLDDPEGEGLRRMRVNIAESPLLVLARRRDANGRPFLDAGLVAAGERLREDFELAQMGPRVTQNWDRFMTAGIDVSHNPMASSGGSEGARARVAAALRELGPGMGDLVLRVCCFLEGIELTERRLGWSARSGKVVLRLALMRLDRHYAETYGNGAPLIG